MKESNKKIGVIGHFGGNENFLDGQTVKTKILCEELSNFTDWEIVPVDTYYIKHNPLKLFVDMWRCLWQTKDVIILLSRNGMRVCFPLLSFLAKAFRYRVYHDVIGGNLDTYVIKYPRFKKYLNSFKVNWVETQGLKNKLEKLGIYNCQVLPNYKRLEIKQKSEQQYNEPYEFCTFSRVMKEKGIGIAIEAIKKINAEAGRVVCKLDVYGPIELEYNDTFASLLEKNKECVQYKGCVDYAKSADTIESYYALLFPTFWDGEGFPGTIIDAFAAGIPVIASDWNCNSEIVINKKNGLLYPNNECEDLKSSIEWLINNQDKTKEMKKNCVLAAQEYLPEKHMKVIIDKINKG